jgi:hypothetical protein
MCFREATARICVTVWVLFASVKLQLGYVSRSDCCLDPLSSKDDRFRRYGQKQVNGKFIHVVNWTPRQEDVRRSGDIAPHILNLGTRKRSAVCFTLRHTYAQERTPVCIGRGWVGHRTGLDPMVRKWNVCPCHNRTLVVRPAARHCTGTLDSALGDRAPCDGMHTAKHGQGSSLTKYCEINYMSALYATRATFGLSEAYNVRRVSVCGSCGTVF